MRRIMTIVCVLLAINTLAQTYHQDTAKTLNFPELREIVNSDIPGAPILEQPVQIKGTESEIRIEKHGLIYPAFYDWNRDGKKDLLLGEFETGEKHSFIKVYLNDGTDKEPSYTGEYFYATDVNGDTITNYQWCCIGIHPRIVDLDQDGHLDILSGQYNPGLISWWRGSEKGFLPRQFIEQEGYQEGVRLKYSDAPWETTSFAYWNYTSADFADFNGDGLLDLFVGGSGGMRVALNTGTKEQPKFGFRNYLYHINGKKLSIDRPSDEQIKEKRKNGEYPLIAGTFKSYLHPLDWDGDGLMDLLVTHGYYKEGHNAVEFFRGVETDKGLRFEQPIPLFTAENGEKVLPGCQPMITIEDYNKDGVNDIVMGLAIPTIKGYEVSDKVAWSWLYDLKINMPGKDAGINAERLGGVEGFAEKVKDPHMRKYYLGNLEDPKYITLRHRGYVFVFYGKKNEKKARAIKVNAQPIEENILIKNEINKASNIDGPVQYVLHSPEYIKTSKEAEISVRFKLKDGWYLYSDNVVNTAEGFIPTSVIVESENKKVELLGEISKPKEHAKGGMMVYDGDEVVFTQKFILQPTSMKEYNSPDFKSFDSVKLKVKIRFQTCDENMCLPPEERIEELDLGISRAMD